MSERVDRAKRALRYAIRKHALDLCADDNDRRSLMFGFTAQINEIIHAVRVERGDWICPTCHPGTDTTEANCVNCGRRWRAA